jgi:soluble lytic murein transglycosylase-like protein
VVIGRGTRGQASVLLVAGLAAILVGAVILGAAERAAGRGGNAQRAADLAALAGATAMDAAYPRLFEPAQLDGRANPRHLEVAEYLARARVAAEETARRNGATDARVAFPDADSIAPVRVRVEVADRFDVRAGHATHRLGLRAVAVAELAPPGADGIPGFATGSGYDGPLAYRQGKPMRPDVAQAFDRMARAARTDGIALLINSALRTDAEQAVLWAAHPDPKWVAPPGTSLHRYGTELDLGPASAYAWLQANAGRFHFIQRYANEPWHYGYTLNARSTRRDSGGAEHRALPGFVPDQYAAPLAAAAQRWNVSATLLAAQLYAESGFNPFARSPAGAQGIAQFMPGTAAGLGLDDPFDAPRAIDAQAHLMRDLLRRFAAVPLALAAYNAGEAPVAACGCVPPYPETRAYVARILGLMSGAGEPLVAGTGLTVRLVR